MAKKTCLVCGTKSEKYILRSGKAFCCVECASKHMAKHKERKQKVCEFC